MQILCAFDLLAQGHKAGRRAGASARQKHAVKKGGGRTGAVHATGRLTNSRAERMNAAKLQRCWCSPDVSVFNYTAC